MHGLQLAGLTGGVCLGRKEKTMEKYTVTTVKQIEDVVQFESTYFGKVEFNTEDVIPLHIPIIYDGEEYYSGVSIHNGDYNELVPIKAIYNPSFEMGTEVLSVLIYNNPQ